MGWGEATDEPPKGMQHGSEAHAHNESKKSFATLKTQRALLIMLLLDLLARPIR